MPAIKLHLEQEELDAIERLAQRLVVKPEAIAYTALNRLMLDCHGPELRTEVVDTWEAHRDNLPLWSDSARSVHIYECKPDDESHPSPLV